MPLPRSKIPVQQQNEVDNSAVRHNDSPVATVVVGKQPSSNKASSSLHARFFSKRSKTDLGSDGLAAYKARRPGGVKYPAPKVPAAAAAAQQTSFGGGGRPVPQQRRDPAAVEKKISRGFFGKKNSNNNKADPLIISEPVLLRKSPSTSVSEEVVQTQEDINHQVIPGASVTAAAEAARLKPELKEKPQFSTFKSAEQRRSTPQRETFNKVQEDSQEELINDEKSEEKDHRRQQRRRRMSKTVSEGDLINKLRDEEEREEEEIRRRREEDENRVIEHILNSVDNLEPVSIVTVNSDDSNGVADANSKELNGDEEALVVSDQHVHQDNNEEDDGAISKLVIDTSKAYGNISKVKSLSSVNLAAKEEEEEDDEEMTSLLPPPPKPFMGKSEPLQITTEPLVDDEEKSTHFPMVESMSESADRSCSTSFESNTDTGCNDSSLTPGNAVDIMSASANTTDDSVGSPLPLIVSGDGGNHDLDSPDRTKSPSSAVSTVSRTPPSPTLTGLAPLRRHVLPDWDEYSDGQTGRKFYYNRTTKEKSWKPPRKPKSAHDLASSSSSHDDEGQEEEEDDFDVSPLESSQDEADAVGGGAPADNNVRLRNASKESEESIEPKSEQVEIRKKKDREGRKDSSQIEVSDEENTFFA